MASIGRSAVKSKTALRLRLQYRGLGLEGAHAVRMDPSQVHYELYVRRTASAPWTLDMASESRAAVVETAESLMAQSRAAAVRVTRETFDPDTREFRSVGILSKGRTEASRKRKIIEDREPLCITPSDLYSLHARDRIGRLLEAWLARRHATPFELLHRPDLVEALDAASNELQHAVQKIAVPEAQARGLSVHELIRSFQALIERAILRVLKDARAGAFPDLEREDFAAVAERLAAAPDAAYFLGAAVAARLATCETWSAKVGALLDLADAAPPSPPARKLAFEVIEQPLAEILELRAGLVDLLGPQLDLGGRLAAMTRLAASETVNQLIAIEPAVAQTMPPLEGEALRLAEWLQKPGLATSRSAVGRRVLHELAGPRRLRPADPGGEIDLLRGLAMALTAAAGQLLPSENVQDAFVARSRMLVASEFVLALRGDGGAAGREAEQLIWLAENVIGAANKRQAAAYLLAHVASLGFETELRQGADPPGARLAALAALQKGAARAGLAPEDLAPVQAKLGEVGGLIEADARISAGLFQAPAPLISRLTLLLRLAVGDAAPLGPAADRARGAAMKLLRSESARSELAARPEQLAQVRDLIRAAGLAA